MLFLADNYLTTLCVCVCVCVCACVRACVRACALYINTFFISETDNDYYATYEVSLRMLLHVAMYVNTVYYCILYHKQAQCQTVNGTFTRLGNVLSKCHVTCH